MYTVSLHKKIIFCLLPLALLLSSCESKTKKLLVKKWDCVQVENLAPVNKTFLSREDSLVTARLEVALQNLSWNFTKEDTYQCSTAGIVTAQGNYNISPDNKLLTLSTQNNTLNYSITTITEQELVLKGYTESLPVILHFRPH